jgi:hypothetical protein
MLSPKPVIVREKQESEGGVEQIIQYALAVINLLYLLENKFLIIS